MKDAYDAAARGYASERPNPDSKGHRVASESSEQDLALGKRIRLRLAELEMRSADLARATGLGTDYIAVLLAGRIKDPGYSKLKLVADALNCNVEWVAEGTGEESRPTIQPEIYLHDHFGLDEHIARIIMEIAMLMRQPIAITSADDVNDETSENQKVRSTGVARELTDAFSRLISEVVERMSDESVGRAKRRDRRLADVVSVWNSLSEKDRRPLGDLLLNWPALSDKDRRSLGDLLLNWSSLSNRDKQMLVIFLKQMLGETRKQATGFNLSSWLASSVYAFCAEPHLL